MGIIDLFLNAVSIKEVADNIRKKNDVDNYVSTKVFSLLRQYGVEKDQTKEAEKGITKYLLPLSELTDVSSIELELHNLIRHLDLDANLKSQIVDAIIVEVYTKTVN